MRIWTFLLGIFDGDENLAMVALAVALLTVLSAAVGIFAKSMGLYTACCALFVCIINAIYFVVCEGDGRLPLLLSIEGSCAGFGYILGSAVWGIRVAIERRKLQRRAIKRSLQFTLPDRENRYLQDRLHTALHIGNEEICTGKRSELAKLGYARRMLATVKAAPLSPVERMDVEEMANSLSLYDKKGGWSASDIKALSEIFSRLLKLASKYEVAV